MPAFIRPWKWNEKPPIGAQINWGHPLAQGLKGCFLLNEQGPLLSRNLVSNFTYGVGANPSWESKIQIGYSLVSDANQEGINGVAESFIRFGQRGTILWRGSFSGTPDINTSMTGVLYDNASSSPFVCYNIYNNGSNNIAFGINNPSFQTASGRAITTFTDGLVHQFVLAFNTNSTSAVNNESLYSDNAYLEAGGAASGTISYSSDSRFVIGEASSARNSKTNSQCVYIWENKLGPSEVSWLWNEPFCMIQLPKQKVSYFFFGTGTAQSLSCIAESASQVIITASNSKPLSCIAESQSTIETGMIASFALSSIFDSASEIVTLLSKETTFPSLIAESQSGINPLLGELVSLSVLAESASTVQALVGKQIPLSVLSQSASEALPSFSRVFTGGIADFNIAIQVLSPSAALDTGNRPVAFLFADNDNEAAFNPNLPNSAPDDSNFSV